MSAWPKKRSPLLPSRRTKERSIVRQRLGHSRAFGIQVAKWHRLAPPVGERRTAETQREGNKDDAERRADVDRAQTSLP